jgi:hypothetical protein
MATIPSGCQNLKKNPDIGDYCCSDPGATYGVCPANAVCNAQSKCEKGPNYCTKETEKQDCQGDGKYLGLTCVSGQCACTKIGSLCTDTTVCVPGSTPGPDPGTGWPSNYKPAPPSDVLTQKFTGLCSTPASQAWFSGQTCGTDQEYLGAIPNTTGNNPPTPQCVPVGNWTGDSPWGKYQHMCYIPKPG